MKEIIVIPGDDIRDVFWKAWQVYIALKRKEPISFHLNDTQVVIYPRVDVLTDDEAKEIVERGSHE